MSIKKLLAQRLLGWSILAAILMVAITIIAPAQLSVTVYKLSLVSIAVVLGYHLDRQLFPYASPGSYLVDNWKNISVHPTEQDKTEPEYPIVEGYQLVFAAVLLRRACVVAAVVVGVTMGL